MPVHWQGFLSQLAVIAAITTIWGNVQEHLNGMSAQARALVFGAVMGVGAVSLMLFRVDVGCGMLLDMRAAPLSIAGFFGGPVSALIAWAMAAVYRFYLGGPGAGPGSFTIGLICGIGIVGHRLVAARQIHRTDIIVLAAVIAFEGVFGMLAMPRAVFLALLPKIWQPLVFLTFASTLIGALAIFQEERRRALLATNMIYGSIIAALPDCLNAKDTNGRFLAANPATARLMRAEGPSALIGKTDFDFYPRDIATRFQADEASVLDSDTSRTIEQSAMFSDGTHVWLSTLKAPFRDQHGHLIGLITHNRDITDQKRLRDELKSVRHLFEVAIDHMADGLVLYDRDGTLLLRNNQYCSLFPKTADLRVVGARLTDIIRASIQRGEHTNVDADGIEAWIERARVAILSPGDRLMRLDDGRYIESRTQRTGSGGSLILLSDVTKRKQAEDALTRANDELALLAVTDGLTGLTNRRGFDQTLEKEFARSARDRLPLSLLMIDVDLFKSYNDTYGHSEGDACLRLLGATINATLCRPGDVACRYGGEEFVTILPNTSSSDAIGLAETLRAAVRDLDLPHVDSAFGIVTISIGVSTFAGSAAMRNSRDLIDRADHALYAAKMAGRDRVDIAPGLVGDAQRPRLAG